VDLRVEAESTRDVCNCRKEGPITMRPLQIAVPTLFLVLLAHAPAQAAFNLGLAANYVILTDPRVHNVQFTSDSFITGNVGVSETNPTTSPKVNGGNITGNLDFAGPINVNNATVSGTTSANVGNVTTAYNTLTSLSSTLGAESGTSLTLTNTGTQIINASSGTLDGSGNRVFTVSAADDFNVTKLLTINGSASDYVVINIVDGAKAVFHAGISLTGGITSDHVLYNILGSTGGEVKGGSGINGDKVYGTILAVDRKFNMDNTSIVGRVFGGGDNDFQLVSNFRIVQPAVESDVPEPASFILWSVLALTGAVAGRRRQRQAV